MEEKKTVAKKTATKKKKADAAVVTNIQQPCQCEQLQKEVEELKSHVESLKRELAESVGHAKSIEDELAEEQKKNKKLNDICKIHERREKQIESQIKSFSDDAERCSKEYTKKHNELKSCKLLVDELRQQNAELKAYKALPWYKKIFRK